MSNKTRLDVLLVEQGLLESRQKAQAVIMAGSVFVDGQRDVYKRQLISSASTTSGVCR